MRRSIAVGEGEWGRVKTGIGERKGEEFKSTRCRDNEGDASMVATRARWRVDSVSDSGDEGNVDVEEMKSRSDDENMCESGERSNSNEEWDGAGERGKDNV